MAEVPTIVVIGGGYAAGWLCKRLVDHQLDGHIVLICEEGYLPYLQRPLSAGFLRTGENIERLYRLAPDHGGMEFYHDASIELRLGVAVVAVDPEARQLQLANGEFVHYDALILAPELTPISFHKPEQGTREQSAREDGDDETEFAETQNATAPLPASICTLSTLSDCLKLRARLQVASRLLIVGGGVLGMEAAAVANQLGCLVTVIEAESTVLPFHLHSEVSQRIVDRFAMNGVHIKTNDHPINYLGDAQSVEIECATGETIRADTLLLALGARPNIDLARAAGLAIELEAIAVDLDGHSSLAAIWAVGDSTVVAGAHVNSRDYGKVVTDRQIEAVIASLLGKTQRDGASHAAIAQRMVGQKTVARPWYFDSSFYGMEIAALHPPNPQARVIWRDDPMSRSGQANGAIAFEWWEGKPVNAILFNAKHQEAVVQRIIEQAEQGLVFQPLEITDCAIELTELA